MLASLQARLLKIQTQYKMSDVEKAKKILSSVPEAVEDIKEEVEDVIEAVEKVVQEVAPVVGLWRSLFCCGK